MKKIFLSLLQAVIVINCFSQNVGIGNPTPHASALLDISSTDKGVLIPRVTTTQRNAILSPAKGLMVFDSTFNSYWYYTGTDWKQLGGNSFSSDSSLIVGKQTGSVPSFNCITNYNLADSSAYFYDSGGPAGNYGNNENFTVTILTSSNQVALNLQVISNSLESPYDSLIISDDYNNRHVLLGNAIGTYRLFGNVKIQFKTNFANTQAGFAIRWDKLFLGVADTYDSTQLTGWYFNREKLYMRGGLNRGNQWSPDSSGLLSFSYGDNVQAKGIGAFAAGTNTKATGDHSSVSIGWQTVATGKWGSVAIGDQAKATGNSGATALGSHTLASGLTSTALGDHSIASGFGSTALGFYAEATGNTSMAFGNYTEASGNTSTAFGNYTIASGNFSTASGYQTIASGDNSTTSGNYTKASGATSTAWGSNTIASGNYSTAWGFGTSAGGYHSTALGYYTKSKFFAGFAAGYYNDSTNADAPGFDPLNRIFQIGNGTSDNLRSNAMTILQNGNTGIGVLVPSEKLDVTGNGKFTGSLTVANGKGLIRNIDGTQLKKLSSSTVVNASFTAGQTQTFTINFPESFSSAPEVYVGNIVGGTGGWAEVIMTVAGVTTTGAALYVFNPRATVANVNFTVKIIAIGAQ
jgi:hypothetical protein